MKNIKNVSTGTWIRTALVLLALVNQGLVLAGKSVLPISDEDLTNALTIAFTSVSTILAWWKNNNFTTSSQESQEYLTALKASKKNQAKAKKAQAELKALQQMAEATPSETLKTESEESENKIVG